MRALALVCLLSLTACLGSVHQEGFAATGPFAFLYSAHTNTVMSDNDDGTAERLRRDWIVDALKAHGMCPAGYAIETRRFVLDAIGPFGNGGDILYRGRCIDMGLASPVSAPAREPEQMFINDKIRGEKG
jgi:hypothetical protein